MWKVIFIRLTKKEDYTLLEQCNIDSKLDLVSEYIISSNIIEDCIINGNNNFSDNIFFVDCESVVDAGANYTSTAILGNPFATAPPYFYNTRLMNNQVLDRWNPLIPNSITSFQGSINNIFRAANTTILSHAPLSYTTYFPFQFNDDFNFPNFDGNGVVNNYGNGTVQGTPVSQANSRYTCASDGEHVFYHQFKITTLGSTVNISHGFARFNSSGVFIQSDGTLDTVFQPPNSQIVSHQANFNCNAGDYIEVHVTVQIYGLPFAQALIDGTTNETYFACLAAPNTGGIFNQFNNKGKVAIVKADFEYSIPNADFYDIQANPFQKIAITYNDTDIKSGWIDTLKFNHVTSEANITLTGTAEMLN